MVAALRKYIGLQLLVQGLFFAVAWKISNLGGVLGMPKQFFTVLGFCHAAPLVLGYVPV
jgi:hypothetical protein